MICEDVDFPAWLSLDFLPGWLITVFIAISILLFIWAEWRQWDGLRKVAVNLVGASCAIEALKLMPILFAA